MKAGCRKHGGGRTVRVQRAGPPAAAPSVDDPRYRRRRCAALLGDWRKTRASPRGPRRSIVNSPGGRRSSRRRSSPEGLPAEVAERVRLSPEVAAAVAVSEESIRVRNGEPVGGPALLGVAGNIRSMGGDARACPSRLKRRPGRHRASTYRRTRRARLAATGQTRVEAVDADRARRTSIAACWHRRCGQYRENPGRLHTPAACRAADR